MSLLPPARSWPQRLPWRWSIAELRTSPVLTPRNYLTITLPASNRQSPGRSIIPWTADPAYSTPPRSAAPPIPGISPSPNNRCSVPNRVLMQRSRKRRYSITSSASASSVERNVDVERLGGFHIDGHLKFGRLHNRQIGTLLTFENTGGINAGLTVCIGNAGRVAHQTAGSDIIAQVIDRGNSMSSRHSDNP